MNRVPLNICVQRITTGKTSAQFVQGAVRNLKYDKDLANSPLSVSPLCNQQRIIPNIFAKL